MEIKVYTSPGCLFCRQLKDFLKDHQVEFKEIDLSENQQMIDDFIERTGQMSVPVTEINQEMIIGFDLIKLKEKLNLK
jgi:glutaredoxin